MSRLNWRRVQWETKMRARGGVDARNIRHRKKAHRPTGDPCPDCGHAMQIREHRQITAKLKGQAFYYRRWFLCTNINCKTTTVMPERFRIWNATGERRAKLERWLSKKVAA